MAIEEEWSQHLIQLFLQKSNSFENKKLSKENHNLPLWHLPSSQHY